MATALGWMAIDQLVGTMGTDALDDIADVLHLKSFGYLYPRDFLIFEADGFATLGAGQVDVLGVQQAVFLLTAAVIDRMHQLLFDKQIHGAEQGTPIDRRQQTLQVCLRKDVVKLEVGSPN